MCGVIDTPGKIGQRLVKLRTVMGLKQAQMSEQLCITQSAWSQYESGKRTITLEVAGVLAARFGLTLDWIYRGDPSGLPMRLATLLGV